MKVLADIGLSEEARAEIAGFVKAADDDEAGKFLHDVLKHLEKGDDIVAIPSYDSVSPAKAAQMIGTSSTHLYKLLDRNVIPHYRVGTHRHLRLEDLSSLQSIWWARL